ncbi:hypothetical protein L1887_51936 [Cichorium endivia]|nr:hypothetical protein L1887_51936 [Cichorium endivia]
MIIEFCAGSDDNSENLRRDWPYIFGICALDQPHVRNPADAHCRCLAEHMRHYDCTFATENWGCSSIHATRASLADLIQIRKSIGHTQSSVTPASGRVCVALSSEPSASLLRSRTKGMPTQLAMPLKPTSVSPDARYVLGTHLATFYNLNHDHTPRWKHAPSCTSMHSSRLWMRSHRII